MSRCRLSRFILIVVCGCLVGCDRGASPQPQRSTADVAQSVERLGEATEADSTILAVRLELDRVNDEPTIDWDTPFRVVLTNSSRQPLRIWNPKTQAGYFQYSLHFTNPQSGENHVARKREIEDSEFWKTLAQDIEPGTEIVEIAANESFSSVICLSDLAWGEHAWTALPDPGQADRFLVAAHFESKIEKRANGRTVWTGKSLSDAISARFVATNLKTPLDFLWNGFPTAAIGLMTADPKLISARGDDECTPLHHAARFGNVDAVRWLLEHGADVNAIAYNGFTPLHLSDHHEVIELILQYKPDLTIHCRIVRETPLQRAVREEAEAQDKLQKAKWRRIVDTYLTIGAEYDALTAIRRDDFGRLKMILKESPQLADDFEGQSLLRTAASLGRLEMCEYLIRDFHVDVNDFERGVGYPIIKGAVEFPGIVKLLIKYGADLKTRITWRGGRTGIWIIGDDATVLHYAADTGVPETITVLIDSGIDIFATAHDSSDKSEKQTALEVAAFFGKAANAEAIVKHSKFEAASLKLRQELLDKCLLIGVSPTWLARDAQRPKLVQVLVEAGANPNVSMGGVSPMLTAAREIHPTHEKENADIKRVIGYLIEHGATVDLFSAVAIGDLDQVQRLLERDPKLASMRGPDGYPALHFAVGMDYREIVVALLKAGCDVDLRNKSDHTGSMGETALHNAAFWGREEIAQKLIEAGANVNAADKNQTTPLDEAHRLANERVAHLLLKNGAKPGVQTKK
jgi:ankyrin repeat protein